MHEMWQTGDISACQRVDSNMVHYNCVSTCTRHYKILRDGIGDHLSETDKYVCEGQIGASAIVPRVRMLKIWE